MHFSGLFLPYHRRFVWLYERALRTECNYAGAQPYWDWTQYYDDLRLGPVFDGTDTSLGSDGIPIPNRPPTPNATIPNGTYPPRPLPALAASVYPAAPSRPTSEKFISALSAWSPRARLTAWDSTRGV